MADLHDDRKKEEEEYGGFEPDNNDDESFMLEDNNDYPAKLPDNFSDAPSATEKIDMSSEPNKEKPKVEEETQKDISDEADNDDEIEVKENIETTDVEDKEPEITDEDEALDLGDDFKKKLQEDIEKSKAKREAKENIDEDTSSESSESAIPISDDADTVVVITDIEADKPSNTKEVDETPAPTISSDIPDNKEAVGSEIPNEPRKKKKTPIWILMLYSSVATFIATIGLVALIWYLMNDSTSDSDQLVKPTEQLANNNESDEKADKVDLSNTDVPKPDSMNKEEMNWLDSMEMDKSDKLISYKEDKEFFSSVEDEFEEKDLTPDNKEEKESQPKKKKAKKVTPKKNNDNLATNDNRSSVTPNEKKSSNFKIDESQFSMPQPNGPAPEKGTFTVQIYSSPSREDAESWLGQLKAQEIPNAMITEQNVKGRTWYRVRYGKFETKEAARASALELGYSQSWIDRIK